MPRSIRVHELGGPEGLHIDEIETPVPGPGEVRLKVRALGLNRAEVMYRCGAYFSRPPLPAPLGYEASGEIEEVGSGVEGWRPGDEVSVIPAFSFSEYGLYGEQVLAPARALVRNPRGQSWEEAAASWMQYATAWGGLIHMARLAEGDAVLLPAASSSIGLAAIQIANLAGARPIALTRTEAKRAALLEAGAAHVVVTGADGWPAEILDLTGGKGARIAFDPVGGPDFPELLSATAVGGMVVAYGALSPEVTPLPMLALLGRRQTVTGFGLTGAMRDDATLAAARDFVGKGLAAGSLKPKIARIFPFEEIVDAHRFMEADSHIGKIVVTL